MTLSRTLVCLFLLSLAPPALAAPPKQKPKLTEAEKKEQAQFKKRFSVLAKEKTKIAIKMRPSDDPDILPDAAQGGMVLVANNRMGIYTPSILSSDDILSVVNSEMKTIRRCFKAQLAADPDWNDEVILDLSVKKTGRVSEVSISPHRVERNELGKCLLSEVPKWKFPAFTGELDGGVTQEVVNASFPFSFSKP
ncbi:MAG: AgmX/PglI C-terminal domain-containing protein [Myxococcota bacterium]